MNSAATNSTATNPAIVSPPVGEIHTSVENGIGRITISNPAKFNAMSAPMWEAVAQAFAGWEDDDSVRVVIVQGDGDKAFVAGADIGQLNQGHSDEAVAARMDRAVSAAYRAPVVFGKPVIAKIRGICFGGGLGLAAACDLRICADDARFRMPAGRLGIGYRSDGVQRFVSVLGVQNTLDIFFTARIFDAASALRMGFVRDVVPAAELDGTVEELARTIAGNAPLTLRALKLTVGQILTEPSQRQWERVEAALKACKDSTDFREGAQAFLEKRAPRFEGR